VGLLRRRGHRILIYSQFTMLLDVLEDWLHERQWPYFRLDGTIGAKLIPPPAMSM
jgi:SNF2 family DNA or RNA helicase